MSSKRKLRRSLKLVEIGVEKLHKISPKLSIEL
jgi:hypothetical protein